MAKATSYSSDFTSWVEARNPHEPEFLQAVREFVNSTADIIDKDSTKLRAAKILERLSEPERVITFRVVWQNDKGGTEVNRGYRIQMSSAIGPYKGGLRFHPSVNLSILKFLAFEQIFKNALTGLPMGGGKGGSDFDPKGKSDAEVMRFCQAFMTELSKYIGASTDVPAGDIGVGGREIGYLFGQYKRIRNVFEGVLTGKDAKWGGSLIRPEATGFGVVYFLNNMLKAEGIELAGKRVLVSGSGNVAQFTVKKATELGAKVLTMSDSDGYIYDEEGINEAKLNFVMELKNVKRGRLSEYVKKFKKAKYVAGKKPWGEKADIALPCATQNEINEQDAKLLISGGVKAVVEGANMPTTLEATKILQNAGVLFAPGKASNAGGVAVSGLEMSQNSMRLSWTREEVDTKLQEIMRNIHDTCREYGKVGKTIDYVRGANAAAFRKVAGAMMEQGLA